MSIELDKPDKFGPGWLDTIGRMLTYLAINAVVVPLTLVCLAPRVRGECAGTLDTYGMIVGFIFLAYRLARLPWTSLAEGIERWLDGLWE